MHALLIALAACGQPTELDAGQFLRIIRGLHGDIADVSLVYEAVIEGGIPGQPAVQDKIQGTYVYRSDGATVIDSYTQGADGDALLRHQRDALLRGRLERRDDIPDLMAVQLDVTVESGSGGALNKPGSPNRIFYLWYFESSASPTMEGFENLGWDEIDGRRCLNVRMQRYPSSDKTSILFWIDLQRGGHPLQVEIRDDGKLKTRVDDIRLHSFNVDGEEYWLPVHGVQGTYWDGSTYYSEPTYRETYDVVRGSVRINEHPPDRLFTVEGAPKKPADPGLRRLDGELRRQLAEVASGPILRTDPAGVREVLDARLAEADRQAEMVEASSAARRVWSGGRLVQLGVAALGVVAIVGALALRWRSR